MGSFVMIFIHSFIHMKSMYYNKTFKNENLNSPEAPQ